MDDLISRQQAIDALDCINGVEEVLRSLPSVQPVATDTNVGDTISRQWLLECINDGWIKFDTDKDENRFIHLVRDIAPTIQPEPQEGEWIPVHPIQSDDPGAYMCSKCKTGMWEIRPSSYHYCPNCGAHMRGERKK